jgi:hypothetical protein
MSASFSKTVALRPSLEQLESRDMPSTIDTLLPFLTDRLIVQPGLKESNYWTSNLQTDFNALQSDIVHLGPNHPTTVADLARTMSDYGFAEQTYKRFGDAAELFKAGLSFGVSNGGFEEADFVFVFLTWKDIQKLENIINSQANTANAIAHTPFANGLSLGGSSTIAGLSRSPN